jgi:hypothetical protein
VKSTVFRERSGGAVENGRINGILEVSRAFGDLTLKKFGVLCTPEYMKCQMDREKDGGWSFRGGDDQVAKVMGNLGKLYKIS